MTQSFFGYDIENLRNLLNFKHNQLVKKYEKFKNDWIKNNRCECVKNLREGITINCKHYNKDVKKRYKKEEKEIIQLNSFIIKANLYSNPQIPNDWVHRLKL